MNKTQLLTHLIVSLIKNCFNRETNKAVILSDDFKGGEKEGCTQCFWPCNIARYTERASQVPAKMLVT